MLVIHHQMTVLQRIRRLSHLGLIVYALDFGQNYSHEPLILFKKIVFQNSIIEF